VLAFVLVSSDPPLVLFALSLLYAVSGPCLTLLQVRRRRAERRRTAPGEEANRHQ